MKKVNRIRRVLRQGAACMFGLSATASGLGQVWEAPVSVSTNALDPSSPHFSASAGGRWITVYQRGTGGESRFTNSTNRGVTWSAPATLPLPNGYTASGFPSIDTDGTSGTFLAVFEADDIGSDTDMAVVRSTGNQTTFTVLNPLVNSGNAQPGLSFPTITHHNGSTWWATGVGRSGNNEAVHVLRTLNTAGTWQLEASLGSDSPEAERNADVASDGVSNGVVVMERRTGSPESPSATRAYYSFTSDSGDTWSDPAPLGTVTSTRLPAVTSDGQNHFLAAAVSGTGAGSLLSLRSTDGGATWAAPVPVNNDGPAEGQTVFSADIAADGSGNAVAVWSGSSGGSERRLLFSTSRDRGATWSVPDILSTSTASTYFDEYPQIHYDGNGRWAAVWQRRTTGGTTVPVELLASRLIFPVRADISVTQTDSPDPAEEGGDVTYSITVRNDGPSSASNVILTDTYTNTAQVVTITQSQGTRTETSGSIVFNLGAINESRTATAEVVLRFPSAGTYSNAVAVTADEEDVDTSDRASTETTKVLVDGVELTGEWLKFLYKEPRDLVKGRLKIDSKLKVENLGNQSARAYRILLVFSDDDILTPDDVYAGVISAGRLGPGKTRTHDFDKHVQRFVPWYGRSLLAIIDAELRVEEADEDNNNIMSDPLP